ncbi:MULTISPECIES: enoyl-CoA hydratase-related protein [Bacillus]|uniref:Enoyl-CoA hydratase n=1 Tax=Bacillus glycinifermentans TaxID=1664069 RepID=A0AAJ4D321_9BACI|nr:MULTISPECIES: enoyl-CoA hydratase-related protein [Bacillus]KKB73124.1 enoyl-CoA hydratase [Bacillus sp. TH008]MDU0071400.1 enoyl-CoA hydratase-related protein [Bacillus sp. IG6]MED8019299.1 enoyl-CoA hydratase-related protein [Bacillus glycinifermentans]QAT65517.1 enoyl-CoA hydratase [Bacillus glycinifermentans]WKB79526.1 enoyl-CoA hydratase-related protein [Bacillus glycinifermentans]
MNCKYVALEKEHFITTVTLNNPPVNTLSSSCIAELRSLFRELAADDDTRAIIITGEGRFFAAGADIKEFVSKLGDERQGLALAEGGQALCNEIEALKKPVIAAINGPALGGGFELAMSCHFRIISDQATVGLPELKLGLIPAFGGTQRLRKIAGTAAALDLILTSRPLSAHEAVELKIAQLAEKEEELMKTATAVAMSFVEGKSMTSVMRAVECIIQGSNENMEQGLERERKRFAELFLTSDAKEGIHAFVEKRKPDFHHS